MVTYDVIQGVFNALIYDETFCRLLAYGEKPLEFTKSKPDIVGSKEHLLLMKDIIRCYPQPTDMERIDRARVSLYKGFMRDVIGENVMQDDVLQIDLYIPTRLMDEDGRSYLVEDKIESILQNYKINGTFALDYSLGVFSPLPSINNYAVYKMSFTKKQIKKNVGYGRL